MGSTLQSIWDTIYCCGKKTAPENRTICVSHKPPSDLDAVVQEKYPGNRVVSSRYTWYNFPPKNLFEQFQRIANFYFLCVGIISFVIDSPVSPWTSLMPLIFVVGVTAIKQGYEDVLRHRADREVNDCPVIIIKDGEEVQVKAQDIKVGDIVKVKVNEGIPADLVMLSSENPEGECYITTANLDGETNLKTFNSLPDTRQYQDVSAFNKLRAVIVCQQPITDLYRFTGNMTIHNENIGQVTRSLAAENVLLRGCTLRNTQFVYGCAIYTGQDTKISLNSKFKSHKFSRIERSMNKYLIVFLVALFLEAAILTGCKHYHYSIDARSDENNWYKPAEEDVSFLVILEEFLMFMVLLNYTIPISMYVTIEIQKFFGSLFFEWDIDMYDPKIDEHAKANTSDINEELGQVEYLFSDKTGTLTENNMQFRQCAVDDMKFIETKGVLCSVPDIEGLLPPPVSEFPPRLQDMLTVLVLCHTVRVDRKGKDSAEYYRSADGAEYDYQASSPDEKALVEACCRYNIIFHGIYENYMEVTYQGQLRRYTQHHVLDFDPTRKRMSVIIEDDQGNYYLMVKGAETSMIDIASPGQDTDRTMRSVTDYALLGLRTLVIGQRRLTAEEFSICDKRLRNARTALENREQHLSEAFADIEQGVTILGVTAVEDKLQDGVPETISALREAGIQVWVLTGDKEETAVNVSYSAGHFSDDMQELRLTQKKSVIECEEEIFRINERLDQESKVKGGRERHALIIDGRTLAIILQNYKQQLQELCQRVTTVLCCRMSPIQKSDVVRLMKETPSKPTTAAIGDGANDVSMIQEADVGLGLFGKEGRQAVRSADYAFSRFQFLKKVLLVHGHFFYVRLAILVQYSLYKNVVFITSNFYFQFFAAFSAQSVYEEMCLTMFNITMAALPILIYGLFEQHISQSTLLDQPELYKTMRRNSRLSWSQFITWSVIGVYQSLVIYFGVYFAFSGPNTMDPNGKEVGIFEFGTTIYMCVVFVVNIKLMLHWYYWNGVVFFAFGLTLVGFFLVTVSYSFMLLDYFVSEFTFYGTMQMILSSASVWFTALLVIVTALLPDIFWRAYRDTFSPLYTVQNKKRNRVDSNDVVFNMSTKGNVPLALRNMKKKQSMHITDVAMSYESLAGTKSTDIEDTQLVGGAYDNPGFM